MYIDQGERIAGKQDGWAQYEYWSPHLDPSPKWPQMAKKNNVKISHCGPHMKSCVFPCCTYLYWIASIFPVVGERIAKILDGPSMIFNIHGFLIFAMSTLNIYCLQEPKVELADLCVHVFTCIHVSNWFPVETFNWTSWRSVSIEWNPIRSPNASKILD